MGNKGSKSKSDGFDLNSTLNDKPEGSKVRFRQFIKVTLDGSDEDEVGSEEKDLDFVLITKKVDSSQFREIQQNFFSANFKIKLTNQTKRANLETLLKKSEYSYQDEKEIKGMLTEFREEVLLRVVESHKKWIADLKAKKVLEDRSGETVFNGWLSN